MFFCLYVCFVWFVGQSPIPPEFVFWYQNDRLLNFDPTREGVSVETDHGSRTHSQLQITNAVETDTGNYTCRASNGKPASIYVQVWAGNNSFKQFRLWIIITSSLGALILMECVLLWVAANHFL